MKKIWILCFALAVNMNTHAQIDIGLGAEIGFPMLFNSFVKGHNHASGAPGARVVATFSPKEGVFSGSLIAGFSPTILPVTRFNGGLDVLYMRFNNTNVTLLGRLKKDLGGDAQLLYGIGIGANFLKGTGVQISRRSDNEVARVIPDSTNYNSVTVPSFYANVEYIRPLNSSSNFYYGIGVQAQYINFFSQATQYRVDIIDKNGQYFSLNPELTGNMINPVVFINLYYRFE